MKFSYAISILEGKIDYYNWCLEDEPHPKTEMIKRVKELQQAIKILKKETVQKIEPIDYESDKPVKLIEEYKNMRKDNNA